MTTETNQPTPATVETPFESEMIGFEVEMATVRGLRIRMDCRGGRTYWVSAVRIIGTELVSFSVLEPFRGYGEHSSSFSDGPLTFGSVSSRRLPAALDALPAMSAERAEAVGAYLGELTALCRNQIAQAVTAACSPRLARTVMAALVNVSEPHGRSDADIVWPAGVVIQ